ncbi:rhodanese-related sulfurtransferase [Plasticicumulans lactativorans]|uniref:Rhodanese-related sulfurtransferase n=1 Tax=Plasticicumulans lactativorans TaxID=1133106 RepID=A0A4R2LFP6_9GAMM|nr:rhodanese-like domain-containing protein [Plasticicumulans lactativorans]TCO81757.1 rhodanese-related sulfurtransferase [Plasticicumulans lactativorans]
MSVPMTPAELRAWQTGAVAHVVFDVRRSATRDRDPVRIPGARWRDPGAVAAWGAEVEAALPVVVYCVHGHEVSQGVARALRERGCDARFLQGGLEAWKVLGFATVPLEEMPS